MIAARHRALQTATEYLGLFVSRTRGMALPLSRQDLESELRSVRLLIRDVQERKKTVDAELRKLKIELMNVETERSALHFKSYTLFNQNTALAIRLSALSSRHSSGEAETFNRHEFDRILDRYVFRVGSSTVEKGDQNGF